ncbi:hypothetical protein C1H46_010869 [Malus baccata]|uniref:Uncharacterized protein n=1 Tax=Malus baccata TaxID=106549 RepID=A0A540MXQ8_MALBA|nr:hypothetical protein C1H46_010869 [Malus baccata]
MDSDEDDTGNEEDQEDEDTEEQQDDSAIVATRVVGSNNSAGVYSSDNEEEKQDEDTGEVFGEAFDFTPNIFQKRKRKYNMSLLIKTALGGGEVGDIPSSFLAVTDQNPPDWYTVIQISRSRSAIPTLIRTQLKSATSAKN